MNIYEFKKIRVFHKLIFVSLMLIRETTGYPQSSNHSMTRCLSSEPGPFTKVDFKVSSIEDYIDTQISVVLGYSDRWLRMKTPGKRVYQTPSSSWRLYRLMGDPVESQELTWFGISEQAEATGYNGNIFPGFLDLKFPSGEAKRFMLECYVLPFSFWRE